jgi:NAD-dependent dihydropyrimidine dehydrogenase PreA subunit
MSTVRERPKPDLLPEFCKGCGRCIDACPKHCITLGTEINAATGLMPVSLHLDQCNGCGLCMVACPEPYGLHAEPGAEFVLEDPRALFGAREGAPETVAALPAERLILPQVEPLVVKGRTPRPSAR